MGTDDRENKEFAGDDYEVAVVPPKARSLLSRFDDRSRHCETKVVDGKIVG